MCNETGFVSSLQVKVQELVAAVKRSSKFCRTQCPQKPVSIKMAQTPECLCRCGSVCSPFVEGCAIFFETYRMQLSNFLGYVPGRM